VDEKLKIQVGPKTAPLMDDVLDYDKVMASLDGIHRGRAAPSARLHNCIYHACNE
jgi:pyruvate-formate lyase